ncbi:hypothetical protein D9M68_886810 [compost metagenome]
MNVVGPVDHKHRGPAVVGGHQDTAIERTETLYQRLFGCRGIETQCVSDDVAHAVDQALGIHGLERTLDRGADVDHRIDGAGQPRAHGEVAAEGDSQVRHLPVAESASRRYEPVDHLVTESIKRNG